MSKELNSISFQEFSHDPIGFFERVIRESKAIVVENERGERAVLKPLSSSKAKKRTRTEADHQAFLASAGGWKDVDVDHFLKDNYESRRLNSRPPVEL